MEGSLCGGLFVSLFPLFSESAEVPGFIMDQGTSPFLRSELALMHLKFCVFGSLKFLPFLSLFIQGCMCPYTHHQKSFSDLTKI